jgi:hypothetical protein
MSRSTAVALLLLVLAPVSLAEDLEQRDLKVVAEPALKGERHQVSRLWKTIRSWKGPRGEEGLLERGGKTSTYQATIADVDSRSRPSRVVIRYTNDKGETVEQAIAKGERPQGKDRLCWTWAQGYFIRPIYSRVYLYGLSGTLRVGESVSLPENLWKDLVWGKTSNRVTRYLGCQKKTGYAVVEIGLTLSEPDVPIKGATTTSRWAGRLVFDPKGPRLIEATLDSEAEVELPAAQRGKGTLVTEGIVRMKVGVTKPGN